MSKKLTDEEFDRLIASYQNQFDLELDGSIEALLELRADGELSEELTQKILKFLVGKHVKTQIMNEVHSSHFTPYRNNRKSMKYMRFTYGRKDTTEEVFAI